MGLAELVGVAVRRVIVARHHGVWSLRNKISSSNSFGNRVRKSAYYATLDRKGSWISHLAKFAGPPVFPHGITGVFVAGAARIGKNAVIFHQVTIGSNRLAGSKGEGAPTIGENCYFGAGAKVIGNVTIGANCRIGANCVVVEDLPDDAIAVMPKPRVLDKGSNDNRFFRGEGLNRRYYDNGKWCRESEEG